MATGNHITPEQRQEILRLRKQKLKLREISDRINISINACHKALRHVEGTGSIQNKVRASRPRKTTVRLDRVIHRLSDADRHKTAVNILAEISPRTEQKISVLSHRPSPSQ